MPSFMALLDQAMAQAAVRDADPLREKVSAAVRGMDAVSTAALLDLIGVPNTTGNARRISKIMVSLGYVAIKSRQFMPGGWRNTVSRGWARPIRKCREQDDGQHRSK